MRWSQVDLSDGDGEPERADDTWIPGQVRFIVPNESRMEDLRVRDENERN